jgi:hypothetical protein
VVNSSSHGVITLQDDEGTLFKVNGQRLKIFLEHVSAISTGWGKPSRRMYAPNHVQEDEVVPTKPKVKSFNGHHQPKKSKSINKAKGGKKTEIKETPAKASSTSSPLKRTKKVWRVKRASSSLPLRDQTSPRSTKQSEESRSQTLNDEPSPRGKPVFISYFPFNHFISCINHV